MGVGVWVACVCVSVCRCVCVYIYCVIPALCVVHVIWGTKCKYAFTHNPNTCTHTHTHTGSSNRSCSSAGAGANARPALPGSPVHVHRSACMCMHACHNTQTLTQVNVHTCLQVKLASVDALGQALFAGSPMRAAAAKALEACARDEPPAMSHGPVGGVVQRCLAELLVREPCGGGGGGVGGGRCRGDTDIAVMSAGEWEGYKECVRLLGALETQYHDGFAPLLVWVLDQTEEAAAAAVERFRQLPQAPPEGGGGEGEEEGRHLVSCAVRTASRCR